MSEEAKRHAGRRFRQCVVDWYERAKYDIDKALFDFDAGWYPDVCYHSQQSAEKILKAFLWAQGVRIKGHRIEDLMKLAENYGIDFSNLLRDRERIEELSDQYFAPRYPNFRSRRGERKIWKMEDYTEDLAESCLEVAREIWRKVERGIKEVLG